MEEPLSAMVLCEIHHIAMIKQEILENKSVACLYAVFRFNSNIFENLVLRYILSVSYIFTTYLFFVVLFSDMGCILSDVYFPLLICSLKRLPAVKKENSQLLIYKILAM